MTQLPQVEIQDSSTIYPITQQLDGDLINAYNPLHNLSVNNELCEFTTNNLNFDLDHPVDIVVLNAYDGAVNLVLNDDKNEQKLINTRFSVIDNQFHIPDHIGNKDTNIYSDESFKSDAQLVLKCLNIIHVDYNGLISNAGKMKCGSYAFYFKLADADYNETEVIAESQLLFCHMGDPSDIRTFRMGMEDEQTDKAISFTLTNIPAGFEYIHVYFSRISSSDTNLTIPIFSEVVFNYPIIFNEATVVITGNELINTGIDPTLVFTNFIDVDKSKTITSATNMLFLGNNTVLKYDVAALLKIAYGIIPRCRYITDTYSINNYTDNNCKKLLPSYNSQTSYYTTGYHADEIYQFAVCFILDNGITTKAFPLIGVDFNYIDKIMDTESYLHLFSAIPSNENLSSAQITPYESISTDNWITKYDNNLPIKLNGKGVFKTPSSSLYEYSLNESFKSQLLYFEFDLSHVTSLLEENNVKGCFFVRKKRIPTILANGVAIGITNKDRGGLPVIQKEKFLYVSQSFLSTFGESLNVYLYRWFSIKNKETGRVESFWTYINRDNLDAKDNFEEKDPENPNTPLIGDETTIAFKKENWAFSYKREDEALHSAEQNRTWAYGARFDQISIINNNKLIFLLGPSDNATDTTQPYAKFTIDEDNNVLISILTSDDPELKGQESGNLLLQDKGADIDAIADSHASALLVPDAEMQEALYNSYFNSSEYCLIPTAYINYKYLPTGIASSDTILYIKNGSPILAKLTLIPEDCTVLTDGDNYYSSIAGNAAEAYKTSDVCHAWMETLPQVLSYSNSVVRGNWGPYVACNKGDDEGVKYGYVYRIKKSKYINQELATFDDFEEAFLNNNLYYRVTDNIEINNQSLIVKCFSGDCFPVLFTHRMMHNFIDPELPTNRLIIDPNCWAKNYRVRCTAAQVAKTHSNLIKGDSGWFIPTSQQGPFANEIVKAFEVKKKNGVQYHAGDLRVADLAESQSNGGINIKAIFKNTSDWELRSCADINRADVNAVGLGQWITLPIFANANYAFRDIDMYNDLEETILGKKRTFYPYSPMNIHDHTRDSNIMNVAIKLSLPHHGYFEQEKVPYIKQEFLNRIQFSKRNSDNMFTNVWKSIDEKLFIDIDKKYGSITKLVDVSDSILVVMQHGLGLVKINPLPQSSADLLQGFSVLNEDVGSMWRDSIIKADGFVFGVDTVAKKIWMVETGLFKVISDYALNKFLIDNIDLSEFTKQEHIGHVNVKTHYNANKHDVIFTYCNDIYDKEKDEWKDGKRWALTYNLTLKKFVSFLDWYPLLSENIDNIFFSFDLDRANLLHTQKDTDNLFSFEILDNNIILTNYKDNKKIIDPAFLHDVTMDKLHGTGTILLRNLNLQNNSIYCLSYYACTVEDLTIDVNVSNLPTAAIGEDFRFNFSNTITSKWRFYPVFFRTGENVDNNIYININKLTEPDLHITEIKLTKLNTEQQKLLQNYIARINEDGYYFLSDESNNLGCSMELFEDISLRSSLYTIRNSENSLKLWKHGLTGLYDNQGVIKPTHWYGKQHKWYFETVINDSRFSHKIFNNLLILSNKAAPYSFEYEVVGEVYNWHVLKPVIYWANLLAQTLNIQLEDIYKDILSNDNITLKNKYLTYPILDVPDNYRITKIPNILIEFADKDFTSIQNNINKLYDQEYSMNTTQPILTYDLRLNDYKVRVLSFGNDMRKNGRVRGNMMYLEDLWYIEIRPIAYHYYYLDENNDLQLSKELLETRLRDKWIRIKVTYSGTELSLIAALVTLFDDGKNE